MNKKQGSGGFWRVYGPLFAFCVVEYLAQVIVSFIMLIPQLMQMIGDLTISDNMTDEELSQVQIQITVKMMEFLQQYQVQIAGLAALCTLVLTVLLFRSDRKKEAARKLEQSARNGTMISNQQAKTYMSGAASAEDLSAGTMPERTDPEEAARKETLQAGASSGSFFWIAILGFAVCIGANCLNIMMTLAFGDTSYQEASAVLYAAPFWVQIVCLGIIIPVSEEMMFRGLLFKRLREGKTFVKAALWSSVLFSLMHGTTAQFFYTLALGMLLAYVYEKYDTVRAPIVLHITSNLLSVVGTETGYFDRLAAAPGNMVILLVACAFFGSIMFVRIQRIGKN